MPLLRVHSDSPIVSPLEDDEVEASQPAVYPIVTSTPDVHVGRGAMSCTFWSVPVGTNILSDH